MTEEEANFPRPRAWILGTGGGGSGPTMDSKGSESDCCDCSVFCGLLFVASCRVDRFPSLVPPSPGFKRASVPDMEDDADLLRRRLRL